MLKFNFFLIAIFISQFILNYPLFSEVPGKAPVFSGGETLPKVKSRTRSFGLKVNRNDRQEVQNFYREVYLPASLTKNGWSGSVNGCKSGENSPEYQKATEQMINYFRAMAGLPADVTLDPELDAKAIQAAIIFKAQKSLSHNPPRSWRCWSDTGSTAAGNSNIFYGRSGPAAIAGYIEDPGANNTEVGHRRWILHPAQQVMGSGSTDESNALWVFGGFKNERPETPGGVAWPPAGYVPYIFGMSADYRWSFAMSNANFSKARVSASYNNKSLRIRQENPAYGYGDNTLVWNVSGLPQGRPSEDVNVDVVISGVMLNEKNLTFRYTVRFIDMGKNLTSSSNSFNEDAGKQLIMAAHQGKRSDGETALDTGADINYLYQGWTALMIASNNNHEEFVDFLLENNPDLNISLNGQWTALSLAESRGYRSIAAKLRAAGAGSGRSRAMGKSSLPALPKISK